MDADADTPVRQPGHRKGVVDFRRARVVDAERRRIGKRQLGRHARNAEFGEARSLGKGRQQKTLVMQLVG